MCGLCATRGISLNGHLNFIRDVLVLRGPDTYNSKIYHNLVPSISFFASQLKFVGNQEFPLESKYGDLLLANGEIYNYNSLFNDIPKEIRDSNYNDFQFIFQKYISNRNKRIDLEESINSILSQVNGDFAFILCDLTEFQIIIGRDLIGIRPLWYYYKDYDHWSFASEKKLIKNLGIRDALIKQVPPGSWTSFSLVKPTQLQWNFYNNFFSKELAPERSGYNSVNLTVATEEVLKLLSASTNRLFNNLSPKDSKIGIFLSGGLDSTIIHRLSSSNEKKIIPIVIGEEKSQDTTFAINYLNQITNTDYIQVSVTYENIEKELPVILNRIESLSPVDVSIGLSIYFLSKAASSDNIRVCLTGQGADELFAGYFRYEKFLKEKSSQDSLEQLLWNELKAIARNNLERDDLMASSHGIELRFPYLDFPLVEYVSKLPLQFLIEKTKDLNSKHVVNRKIILRNVAAKLSIPQEIVSRKKTAIQYGSGLQKILEKLAKTEHLSLSDYLKSFTNYS